MSSWPLIIVGVALEVIIFILYGIFVRFDDYAKMQNSAAYQTDSLSDYVLRLY